MVGGTHRHFSSEKHLDVQVERELSLWICQDNAILTCIKECLGIVFSIYTSVSVATAGFHPFVETFSSEDSNIHIKRDVHFTGSGVFPCNWLVANKKLCMITKCT